MSMRLDPKTEPLEYTWGSWATLIRYLQEWGFDTDEFKMVNDGDPICADTCQAVAEALENRRDWLKARGDSWQADQAEGWRYLARNGGCEQN